jgi:uncharacterized protein
LNVIMDLKPILRTILKQYTLPLDGDHGLARWGRVLENGLKLAIETGANIQIVSLFAVLHDSCRINESTDPEHGLRAANFATTLRGNLFDLSDNDFQILYRACAGHTHEPTHPEITIQTCWDADRLDLGRVGITPKAARLCTPAARRPEMIKWADGRASFRVIPAFVTSEWRCLLPVG